MRWTRELALAFRRKVEAAAELQDDATALESVELYPKWNGKGMDIVAGKRYVDPSNNKLYKALQSHKSQEDWPPHLVQALFTEVSVEEWPEIPENIPAENPWMSGMKGTWKGVHYYCTMDNCVWNPDQYPAAWRRADE